MVTRAITIALCAFVVASAVWAQDKPFSFRNIELGITPSEFKKISFPDLGKWPNVKPVCTGDQELKKIKYSDNLAMSPLYNEVGVTQCGYVKPDPSFGLMLWAPDFAGIGNYRPTYLFSPPSLPENQRSRLYYISINFPSHKYNEAVAAYIAKYGQPRIKTQKYKIRSGAEFDNTVSMWENSASKIILEHYGPSLDTSSATYVHKEILMATDAAVTKSGGARGAGHL